VLEEFERTGELSSETRRTLAGKAFAQTAAYDAAISGWMTGLGQDDGFPQNLTLPLTKGYGLRYGENPHQKAAFYIERDAPDGCLARVESLGTGAKSCPSTISWTRVPRSKPFESSLVRAPWSSNTPVLAERQRRRPLPGPITPRA